ncbi:MAG: regulatory signaling modulator protein AmpE [Chromatiales bacterium]|nr:MAG: regulatory signaling modulator protein AmpE [Chromatiales bacterium]
MNLFALLLGLAIERLVTHLFHLREFRWLDSVFDRACEKLAGRSELAIMLGVVLLALVLAAPVALVSIALGDALFYLPAFVFAVIVLLFSLGPRDLKEEVDEYCTAVDAGDAETTRRVAKELLEADAPDNAGERAKLVERAIFVQANNRIFGVAFWFIVLGPPGAWLFRVLDLLRRRVAYRHAESAGLDPAVRKVHALVAWIPARLLAGGYALAGSFEDAIADWRGYYQNCAPHMFDVNNDVLSCAGMGAAGRAAESVEVTPSAGARAAMSLVVRTLWLWCAVIAVLTLLNIVS